MREKIKKHCNIISGYAFKSSDLQAEESIPVIKIGNISNGKNVIIDSETQYVNNKFLTLDRKFHICKGDILISLTGSHMNQPNSMVGRACRSYEDRIFLLNQRAGKVICNAGTDKDYIYYLLITKAIKDSIATRAYGAANQVNVSPTEIMNIKWDFHDYEEQKRISSILVAYDNLINVNNKRVRTLEQMAECLYVEWFVRFRFPGYEKAEFVNDSPRGWTLASTIKPRCPKGWHYGCFSELGLFVRGKNITSAEMENGDIPVISAGLEPSGYHNDSNVKGKSLTISASGANAGYLKYNLDDIWAADCSYYQNGENIWFAYCSLKHLQPVISNLQCGAAQPHVHPKHINRLSVIIPPNDVIKAFCETITPFFEDINKLTKENNVLIQQRDLLLPRLMSGRLEV